MSVAAILLDLWWTRFGVDLEMASSQNRDLNIILIE